MDATLTDDVDSELRAQAVAMAEKALEKLPEAVRAAQIGKVSERILKQLKAKAAGPGANGGSNQPGAPVPPMPGAMTGKPPQPSLASMANQPLPPVGRSAPDPPKGIAMCGDEFWFEDLTVRRRLQQKDAEAVHSEQKVLMGQPAEEIKRICPAEGRILGAGAVLRLGGRLGFYGEDDIAYAYRQLSRAVHPDKNRGIAEADVAFKRLSEAADELRKGLAEARVVLRTVTDLVGSTVTDEDLKRPQEALLAEISKALHGVLALSGEGEMPPKMLQRATSMSASSFVRCESQAFLSLWYDKPSLLDCMCSPVFRTVFDSSPKHLRAQFLCALNRASIVEQKRKGTLRSNWHTVEIQFPELGIWQALRDKLSLRSTEKASQWDMPDPNAAHKASAWSTSWQEKLKAILVAGTGSGGHYDVQGEALSCMTANLMALAADLWRDIVDWAKDNDGQRSLQLFAADGSEGAAFSKEALARRGRPDWSFVPASDLFLLVGSGVVGITIEGIFWAPKILDNAAKTGGTPAPPEEIPHGGDRNGTFDKKQEQLDAQAKAGFDWESAWRNKKGKQQMFRGQEAAAGAPSWSRSRSPPRRSSPPSRRRRSGSRDRRRRSRSRSRRRR